MEIWSFRNILKHGNDDVFRMTKLTKFVVVTGFGGKELRLRS